MAEKIVFKKYIYKNRCDVAGCTNMAVKSVGIDGMTPGLLWNMCDECIKSLVDEAVAQGIISDDLKGKIALSKSYSIVQEAINDVKPVENSQEDKETEDNSGENSTKPKTIDAVEFLNMIAMVHIKDIAKGFKVPSISNLTKDQLIAEILDRALIK